MLRSIMLMTARPISTISARTTYGVRSTPLPMLANKARFLGTLTDEEMKKIWNEKSKKARSIAEMDKILSELILGRDINTQTLRDQYQVLLKARELGLIDVDPKMPILNPDTSTLEESSKAVSNQKSEEIEPETKDQNILISYNASKLKLYITIKEYFSFSPEMRKDMIDFFNDITGGDNTHGVIDKQHRLIQKLRRNGYLDFTKLAEMPTKQRRQLIKLLWQEPRCEDQVGIWAIENRLFTIENFLAYPKSSQDDLLELLQNLSFERNLHNGQSLIRKEIQIKVAEIENHKALTTSWNTGYVSKITAPPVEMLSGLPMFSDDLKALCAQKSEEIKTEIKEPSDNKSHKVPSKEVNLDVIKKVQQLLRNQYVPILTNLDSTLGGYAKHIVDLMDDLIELKNTGKDISPTYESVANTHSCIHRQLLKLNKLSTHTVDQSTAITFLDNAINCLFYFSL